MEFKILTQMKLSYESKQNFMKLDEHEIQLLSEINQALQLLQTGVMQRNCNSFGCVDPDNSGQCIYCCKILDND